MFIVYDEEELKSVVDEVFDVAPGKPVLLDKFLDEAIEMMWTVSVTAPCP